jgi:uncharacterized protein DUF4326
MPVRVKVEGDLFHPRVPEGAVYVGRSAPHLTRSPWHNPHQVDRPCKACGGARHSRADVMVLYRRHLQDHPELVARARSELAGRDLACRCDLDLPCHADILLAVVTGEDLLGQASR